MLPIPTILLLSLRFLTKAKIIASERVDPSTYPPSKQKRLKKVAHKADGWVFQTEIQKNWYGNSIGSAAVKIIPNAINKEFITAAEKDKKTSPLTIKAGIMDGAVQSVEEVKALADILPREQLIAKIMGCLNSQATALAYVIQAIADKKAEAGEQ